MNIILFRILRECNQNKLSECRGIKNLIFNLIAMYEKARRWNRKNIDNYVEIYIKADIKKIIKHKKKEIYRKNRKNIVGLDIKAEFPKKPHITINNDFTRSIEVLSKELLDKIKGLNIGN